MTSKAWIAGLCLVLVPVLPASAADEVLPAKAATGPFHELIAREAALAGVPFDVADAVVAVESGYDPTRIGQVGEIGLMQVLPTTAAMLGFRGTNAELARPDVNIHYGALYLAGAWRRADGDLCRTLMKYRAGHGEDTMSPRSVVYCERARAHLAAAGSDLPTGPVPRAATRVAARTPDRGPLALPTPPRFSRAAGTAAFLAKRAAYVAKVNAYLVEHAAERAAYIQTMNATFLARRAAYVKAALNRTRPRRVAPS